MSAPQSAEALARVSTELQQSVAPVYHCIGNHELYNFSWAQLQQLLNSPAREFWETGGSWQASVADRFYFSFQPHPGWTVIFLNPYAISLEQEKGSEEYNEAARILSEYNPNDPVAIQEGRKKGNFFTGMEGRIKKVQNFSCTHVRSDFNLSCSMHPSTEE